MIYKEYIPGKALQQYVKCYYLSESDNGIPIEDKAFATGCIEVMFNLANGKWQTSVDGDFITTPSIELWGQIIKPLAFRSLGSNRMFGIRFYPHTASVFLDDEISLFSDRVSNFVDIAGTEVKTLHGKLLEAKSPAELISFTEEYLLQRLASGEKKLQKTDLIGSIMHELKQEDFFDNIENVASRYGISSRYLQKIFLQHTGLTPKLYCKINRFQNSLLLIAKKNLSLTAIAYECGYFDQSHFIREFRSFTGTSPSGFDTDNTSAILASPNK
ncbi:MAG TPA: helix-turn-helix transcriptional regulator [Chitinophagaceae bacterium]|nr:helix-turn-helix transcriptional regulator [Chitinophagaceae bacterium]